MPELPGKPVAPLESAQIRIERAAAVSGPLGPCNHRGIAAAAIVARVLPPGSLREAIAIALAVALPSGIIAGIMVTLAAGCPSSLSLWPVRFVFLLFMSVLLLCLVVGALCGCVVARCGSDVRCGIVWRHTSRGSTTRLAVLLSVVAAVLLAVPSTGQSYVKALSFRSFTGLGIDWTPPSGYCEQAATRTASNSWLAEFAGLPFDDEREKAARISWLIGNMSTVEKERASLGLGPLLPLGCVSMSVLSRANAASRIASHLC